MLARSTAGLGLILCALCTLLGPSCMMQPESDGTMQPADTGGDDNGNAIDNGSGDGDGSGNGSQDGSGNADKLTLWTQGVRLRGANISQRRVYPSDGDFLGPGPLGPPYTQDDFDRLAALGANYVNISHTGLYTEKPPYQVDTAARDNLDQLLEMIERADMFAVISFRSGPGRGEFALFPGEDWYPQELVNDAMWQDQEAQDAWLDMWRYTAERYRDNPIVVGYDLMVEPNSNHVLYDLFDPAEFYDQYADSLADWNQLHPRITGAIREVDPDTPILVGGMSYSAPNWLAYVADNGDSRTVYTIHQYEPFAYTHQDPPLAIVYPGTFDADGDGATEPVNRAWLDNLLDSTAVAFSQQRGVPVAANEYGVRRYEPGAAAYMADVHAAFERIGVNHAIWAWGPAFQPTAAAGEFDFRSERDPNNPVDVDASDLLSEIRAHWQLNTVRPSNWR